MTLRHDAHLNGTNDTQRHPTTPLGRGGNPPWRGNRERYRPTRGGVGQLRIGAPGAGVFRAPARGAECSGPEPARGAGERTERRIWR